MKIFKWDDNSGDLGVCLPDDLVKRLGIQEGDEVEVTADASGALLIAKACPPPGSATEKGFRLRLHCFPGQVRPFAHADPGSLRPTVR